MFRKPPSTEVSFWAMKKALQEPTIKDKEEEERQKRAIRQDYQ